MLLSLVAVFILLAGAVAGMTYLLQEKFQTRVPTIQTNKRAVRALIISLALTDRDTVIDLGSGNGSTIFLFETLSPARTVGYELSIVPFMVSSLRKRLNRYSTVLRRKNFMQADLSEGTIIYTYLLPSVMKKIAPELSELSQRTNVTIVCCDFPLPGVQSKPLQHGPHTFYVTGERFWSDTIVNSNKKD